MAQSPNGTSPPTILGFALSDIAKLGMNVVLLLLLISLWMAYQSQLAQYITLVQTNSVQSVRLDNMQDDIKELLRQHAVLSAQNQGAR